MVVIEWPRFGLLRYLEVYFPTEEQLAELAQNLGPLDMLDAYLTSAVVPAGIRPLVHRPRKTTFVDLSKGEEAIYARMHASCRYKVRRAEKMRDHFEIVMNTDAASTDFRELYNGFARAKGRLPLLKQKRLDGYLPHADIFMLYFEGEPTCGRLVLRDEESRAVLMAFSATCRLEQGADTITIGMLNRYLHWHELRTYQALGMKRYDFGGAGASYPSVTHFKLSFGGEVGTLNYRAYAGSARIAWKLVHSLREVRGRRFKIKHLPV